MKKLHIREVALFPLLAAALCFSILYVVSIGSTAIDLNTVYRIVVDQLLFKGRGTLAGQWDKSFYQIIWNIRFPRVLFGAFCGAGLSVCGAAMQSLVLNPIADPYILGVSSGASAGAAWALLMPTPFFSGQYRTPAFARISSFSTNGSIQ